MRRPSSLTLRLTLLISFITTVVFLSNGLIINQSINDHFAKEDTKELRTIADVVSQSLSAINSLQQIARIKQRFEDLLLAHPGALLHIRDAQGNPLYSSKLGPIFSSIPLPITDNLEHGVLQDWVDTTHNYKIIIQQVLMQNDDPYIIIIAITTDAQIHFLNQFQNNLWLIIGASIFIMSIMSFVAVRLSNRPLRNIVDQISSVTANDLHTRLSPDKVPAELSMLAHSLNKLLQRLQDSFNRLSHFSADIAHELRTPITNMMTQTQVILSKERDTAQYQETLYSNMEEYERLAHMVGEMLFLAKADNRLNPLDIISLDLNEEVCNLFEYYEAWAEERHVTLTMNGEAQIDADQLMLRRALSNLLTNAIRYTPANKTVHIQLNMTQNEVAIVVQNPGPQIPEAHLGNLFDRFYRVDPSRQRRGEGSGLGLAIVKAIVEAHDGNISATSDETSTCFIINLPIKNKKP